MNLTKTALFGIVLFAQSGFAFPGIDLATDQLGARAARSPRANSVATECANFSGKWKGQCTANGASEESNFDIVQKECESLKMGHEETYIGALDTRGVGIPSGGKAVLLGFVSTTDWSADAQSLNTNFGGIIKVLGNREHLPANGKAVTKLVDGRLLVEAQIFDIKVSCAYDKQ